MGRDDARRLLARHARVDAEGGVGGGERPGIRGGDDPLTPRERGPDPDDREREHGEYPDDGERDHPARAGVATAALPSRRRSQRPSASAHAPAPALRPSAATSSDGATSTRTQRKSPSSQLLSTAPAM